MIEFRTLGRLDLRGDHGTELSSVLVQPKRVALLAYLAVARPHGFHRRDSLLALLWPELEQEHARAALRKAVYHLRRSLGNGVLIGRGDEELALDPSRLTCDAAQLDAALEAGVPQKALDLYQGAFLEGFFVRDAAGFEDWMDRERQRLHSAAHRAAWDLACQAEAAGDAFGAAHWARQAAASVPDDEGALRNLMSMLDRVGDRAGALAAYEEFARRLAREYEAEPARATQALVKGIRGTVVTTSADTKDDALAVFDPPSVPMSKPRIIPAATRVRRAVPVAVKAAVAVAILAFGAILGARALSQRTGTPVSARVVAVVPFSFRGNPELAYLGEGMVNLLATNLDQLGDIRSVDAGGVLALSKSADPQRLDADEASDLATRLGAGLFVAGDIVEVDGHLRLSAALYEARHPTRVVARASAEGAVAQLFELIDEITSELIAGERRAPAERFTRLAVLTTHSVPALKAYLNGEQLFRAGRYNEAVESFQKAVAEDTTFALGYYRLALAHMWGSNSLDREMAQRAITHGSRLATPDRDLLDALLPFFRGDIDEAERQYRAILVRRPQESEVWYPLGEVLFHHNPARGRSASEAKLAFERALLLGPKDGPLTHLTEIAALERDYVSFDTLFSGIAPGSHFYLVGEMVQTFTRGNAAERTRVLAALRDTSDARLTAAARHAMYLLENYDSIVPIIQLMVEPARPRLVRAWGHIQLAQMELSAGRLEKAAVEIRAAAAFDAVRALEHEAWLYSLPFVAVSRAKLTSLRNRLAAMMPPGPDADSDRDLLLRGDHEIHPHVRLYLLGLLDAQLGNHEAALRAADALPHLGGVQVARELSADLAHAVRAEVLRLRGQPAAALAELERARIQFDANRLNGPPFFAQVRERYVRAELLVVLGRQQEALGWFGSVEEHSHWARVLLAPALLRQARIYDALGQSDAAARRYARMVGLWKKAEPRFRLELLEAEQRLNSLRLSHQR